MSHDLTPLEYATQHYRDYYNELLDVAVAEGRLTRAQADEAIDKVMALPIAQALIASLVARIDGQLH